MTRTGNPTASPVGSEVSGDSFRSMADLGAVPELQPRRSAELQHVGPGAHPDFPVSWLAEDAVKGAVSAALRYGLELLERGAMLVRFDGIPCVANRAALDILRQKDCLTLANTGLTTNRASDTRMLVSMVREAIASPQSGEPKESPMCVPRKGGRAGLIVRVLPGPELAAWRITNARTALVTISDPERCLRVDEACLTRSYGLTRGEAALANLMIQGKSIEQAAAELFISEHTARTHLKRIFLKTDTHRQPELVVRLLSSVL